MDLTTASFFSGVGGMDMGLEAAGWRTVSFSEIEPYACSILAERWPEVPNLGCIKTLAGYPPPHEHGRDLKCLVGDEWSRDDRRVRLPSGASGLQSDADPEQLQPAVDGQPDRWRSGQSPVKEGLECRLCWSIVRHRSGCPYGATLWTGGFPCQDLSVAGKRRGMGEGTRSGLAFAFLDLVAVHNPPLILLENVPGLLSSHGGKDMAVLLSARAASGILRRAEKRGRSLPAALDTALQVLAASDTTPTPIHMLPRDSEPQTDTTDTVAREVTAETISSDIQQVDSPTTKRVQAPFVSQEETSDLALKQSSVRRITPTEAERLMGWPDGPYDPPKQDSPRYRCCGNGVVANVAEWLGLRLREEAERA
jgi:DNA (cytosine-5)-methyltransferase 1